MPGLTVEQCHDADGRVVYVGEQLACVMPDAHGGEAFFAIPSGGPIGRLPGVAAAKTALVIVAALLGVAAFWSLRSRR